MNLLQTIKTAAVDAVNASNPVQILIGKVIAIEPLKVQINPKLTLEDNFLIVPKIFSDYEQTVEFDKEIEQDGEIITVQEEKIVTVKNKLQNGEQIVLLKIQGGKKYLILERLGDFVAPAGWYPKFKWIANKFNAKQNVQIKLR